MESYPAAKIEHITRQGKEQDYSKFSRPYIDKSEEEAIFNESTFYTPKKSTSQPVKTTLNKQEEMQELAKLKRAGRLSQKEYNKRVENVHKKHKPQEEVVKEPPIQKPQEQASYEPKIERIELNEDYDD